MLNADKNKLKCPVCGDDLDTDITEKSLICKKRHCFDISADGYVNLSSVSGSGDSKEAVLARKSFLDTGYYKILSDEIFSLVSDGANEKTFVADMGCGDGYYSSGLPKIDGVSVFGADLSKFAVKAAAKRANALGVSDKTLYSVSSVFDVPLKNDTCDFVINLFAPCAENEFRRILKPHGKLILVGAGVNHLAKLKELIYENVRLNDERRDLPSSMRLLQKYTINTVFTPSIEERAHLFTMTPYYYKTSLSDKQKLSTAPITEIEAEFDIYIYENI